MVYNIPLPHINTLKNMNYISLLLVFFLFLSPAHAKQPDPYAIYLKYYQTIGGLNRLKKIRTSYTAGKKTVDRLNGYFKEWTKTPIRYRTEENYTVITQSSGDNGTHAWSKDFNGKVLVLKDKESQQRRQISMLLNKYDHIKRDSKYFSLSYQGQTEINEKPAHIIKMSNNINKDIIWYYFDIHSLLLVKVIEKQTDIKIHTLYQDYRLTDGNIMIAFRMDSEIRPRNKHESIIINEFHANPQIPDSYFSIPPENHNLIHFKPGSKVEKIPFYLNDNLIYLPIQLNGQEKLWIVDSGASHSLIDEDYAKQLGLVIHPGIKGFGFGGNFELSHVKLPSYGTQDVQIKNQTIYTLKGLAQRFSSPQAMGILGYDFLSRFVVKIDYANQSIFLYENSHFNYKGNGNIINAPLKYNTFSLPVTLDKQFYGYWSIDLGAYDASLHYSFAKKHELLQRKGLETLSAGIENAILERTVKFDSLTIGSYKIHPAYINIPVSKGLGTGAIGELAGNLGNSILRHFVIYLDYKNQQVIIEPGKNFNHTFPQNLTGLTIGYSDEEKLPFVAHISPESPAARVNLKIGDDIIVINELPTINIGTLTDIRKFLLSPACNSIQLTIRRNDVIHVTELKCH